MQIIEQENSLGRLEVSAPIPINSNHIRDTFDCGLDSLNQWLINKSLKNEKKGASRTYVASSFNKIIGFYCLSAGAVRRKDTPSNLSRNMPEPIPVIILGRLAVDKEWQGKGLGQDLLSDAIKRAINASDTVGAKALIVHALSKEAQQFYKKCGFIISPTDEMNLMISLRID